MDEHMGYLFEDFGLMGVSNFNQILKRRKLCWLEFQLNPQKILVKVINPSLFYTNLLLLFYKVTSFSFLNNVLRALVLKHFYLSAYLLSSSTSK